MKVKSTKIGKKAPVKKFMTMFKTDMVSWFNCPHCKKLIFLGEPEVVGALKRFKKQYKKLK